MCSFGVNTQELGKNPAGAEGALHRVPIVRPHVALRRSRPGGTAPWPATGLALDSRPVGVGMVGRACRWLKDRHIMDSNNIVEHKMEPLDEDSMPTAFATACHGRDRRR